MRRQGTLHECVGQKSFCFADPTGKASVQWDGPTNVVTDHRRQYQFQILGDTSDFNFDLLSGLQRGKSSPSFKSHYGAPRSFLRWISCSNLLFVEKVESRLKKRHNTSRDPSTDTSTTSGFGRPPFGRRRGGICTISWFTKNAKMKSGPKDGTGKREVQACTTEKIGFNMPCAILHEF